MEDINAKNLGINCITCKSNEMCKSYNVYSGLEEPHLRSCQEELQKAIECRRESELMGAVVEVTENS